MATMAAAMHWRHLITSTTSTPSTSSRNASALFHQALCKKTCESQCKPISSAVLQTSQSPQYHNLSCYHHVLNSRAYSSSAIRTRHRRTLKKSKNGNETQKNSIRSVPLNSNGLSMSGLSPAWKRYWIRQRRKSKSSNSMLGSTAATANATTTTQLAKNSNTDNSQIFSIVDQIKSFGIGSFAGLMGSLAGMGGGFVMIPLMTATRQFTNSASKGSWSGLWGGGLGLHQHQAHGTSLFAVGTTGLAGALGYGIRLTGDDEDILSEKETQLGRDEIQMMTSEQKPVQQPGLVELDTAMALAATAMVTARFGAISSTLLSERALQRALGAFMICMAPLVPGKAYLDAWQDVSHPSNPDVQKHLQEEKIKHSHHEQLSELERLLPASLIGVFSGFLSGMFGVGGGAIVVPSLVLATDMTHHSALGTSLCAMVLPAIVGTYAHAKRGNVNWRVAPMLAIGSFVGAFLGGREVGMHLEEDVLRGGFACLMLVLGVKTWRKGGR